MNGQRTYTLLGADGKPCQSATKGQCGGHRATRIYGRLDCPAALRAIARGGYTRYRVFFADEATAIAAGYRPCATCCPRRYQEWKNTRQQQRPGRWIAVLQRWLRVQRRSEPGDSIPWPPAFGN